jgi:hypothetical protein
VRVRWAGLIDGEREPRGVDKLHFEHTPMFRSVTRMMVFGAAWAWAVIPGACSTKRCSGQPITCARLADRCDSVPGCVQVAACQYSFTAVDTVCQKLTTADACAATTTSACTWAPPACVSACGSITSSQACDDFSFVDPRYPDKNVPCVWSTCSGIPAKQFCDQYPVDQCPATLGCEVMDQDPVGT